MYKNSFPEVLLQSCNVTSGDKNGSAATAGRGWSIPFCSCNPVCSFSPAAIASCRAVGSFLKEKTGLQLVNAQNAEGEVAPAAA
ncbi:MAG TPA: hypothetical protein VHO70_18710 [Chitinispirillaceae bacterium]|nr:hypothetical protein [Chitinispirillaceae bacterium]